MRHCADAHALGISDESVILRRANFAILIIIVGIAKGYDDASRQGKPGQAQQNRRNTEPRCGRRHELGNRRRGCWIDDGQHAFGWGLRRRRTSSGSGARGA